jgi:phosphatidylinositol-bisphosphatase
MEFSDICNISICCATWNVNAKPLPDDYDLKEWLLRPDHPPADIYCVSLQEMVDLNVMNVVVNGSVSEEVGQMWVDRLLKVMNSTGIEYKLVIEKHLVGLECAIFSRVSLLTNVSDVRWSIVYTGGYGVTGNKGGIAVRFDVLDSPVCVVCAHFHANRNNIEARNADFATIFESAVFPPPPSVMTKRVYNATIGKPNDDGSRPYSVTSKDRNQFTTLNVINHEHIFWLGDLNYRIASDLDELEIFDIVQSGNWVSLRTKDQLNMERDAGNVFQNFEEGMLRFPPTYKYQPGTDRYDQRPDKKLRAPAWCDRVLWRSSNKDSIKLLAYSCASSLCISDHKPVYAWFDCGVRKVVPTKAREIYQDLLFSVDKWINASTPKLTIDNRMIDFGTVTLNVSYLFLLYLLAFLARFFLFSCTGLVSFFLLLFLGEIHCFIYFNKYRKCDDRMEVRSKE